MRGVRTGLACAIAVVLAVGCGGGETTEQEDLEKIVGERAPAQTTEPEATPEETTTPELTELPQATPTTSGDVSFGEVFTYDDGLAVSITKGEEFVPSELAFGHEGYPHTLTFEITIENGTTGPFSPELVTLAAYSGPRQGTQVFDAENDVEGSPGVTIPAGGATTWTVGFALDDPDSVVVEITPDYEHDAVSFAD